MKTEKPALQVLQEARLLILDPANWIQGGFGNGNGQMCATGALRTAQGGSHFQTPAYATLSRIMSDLVGRTTGNVAVCWFNDNHTHAEVIHAFDLAIIAETRR